MTFLATLLFQPSMSSRHSEFHIDQYCFLEFVGCLACSHQKIWRTLVVVTEVVVAAVVTAPTVGEVCSTAVADTKLEVLALTQMVAVVATVRITHGHPRTGTRTAVGRLSLVNNIRHHRDMVDMAALGVAVLSLTDNSPRMGDAVARPKAAVARMAHMVPKAVVVAVMDLQAAAVAVAVEVDTADMVLLRLGRTREDMADRVPMAAAAETAALSMVATAVVNSRTVAIREADMAAEGAEVAVVATSFHDVCAFRHVRTVEFELMYTLFS